MSQVKENQLVSPLKKAGKGAGSPEEEASSMAVSTDASETERLVKLVMDMGYPEGEVRLSLAQSNNNVQRAVQILVEGTAGDNGASESRKRRRTRQLVKQLRSSLLGNPVSTDDAIVQMMQNPRSAGALTNLVNGSGAEFMQLLLADEEEEEQEDLLDDEDQEQLETSQEQTSSFAESSPSN
ncbi:uncharacterized protein LOC108088614 [Drosophila ficusphila]|uniref:uncharacterized protein LOC108088614 n=1 Tax=Drosophila ficusphila TaxID=30025 RepID=UPI0007E6E264|nr:uncharacterized protein LOC108088614 [Drosophila ficusphila]